MTFKDQIAKDNRVVFMNLDEFTDIHNVNGKDMPCMIDGNELVDRERQYKFKHSQYADGVYMKQLLIYVREEDFGKLPPIGRALTLDQERYTVAEAINEDGIYSITVEANLV